MTLQLYNLKETKMKHYEHYEELLDVPIIQQL